MRPLGLAQFLGQSVPCGQATLQLMRSPLGQLHLGQSARSLSQFTTPTLGQKIQAAFQARAESRLNIGEETETNTLGDWSRNWAVPAQLVDRFSSEFPYSSPNLPSSPPENTSPTPSTSEALPPPLGQSKPLASSWQSPSQPSLQTRKNSSPPDSNSLNTASPKINQQIQTQIQRQVSEQSASKQAASKQAIVQRTTPPNASNLVINSTLETAEQTTNQTTQNVVSNPAFFEENLPANVAANVATDPQPVLPTTPQNFIQSKQNLQVKTSIQNQSESLEPSIISPAELEENFITQSSQNLQSPPSESLPSTSTPIQRKIENDNPIKPILSSKVENLETIPIQPEIQAKTNFSFTPNLSTPSTVEVAPSALEESPIQRKDISESNIQPEIQAKVKSIPETTIQPVPVQESLKNPVNPPSSEVEIQAKIQPEAQLKPRNNSEIQTKKQTESDREIITYTTDLNDTSNSLVISPNKPEIQQFLQSPKLQESENFDAIKSTESTDSVEISPPISSQSKPDLQAKPSSNEPVLLDSSLQQIQENTSFNSEAFNFDKNTLIAPVNYLKNQPKIEKSQSSFLELAQEFKSIESPSEQQVKNPISEPESLDSNIQRKIEPAIAPEIYSLKREEQVDKSNNQSNIEIRRNVDLTHPANQEIGKFQKSEVEDQEKISLKSDIKPQPTLQQQLETSEFHPSIQSNVTKNIETQSESLAENSFLVPSLNQFPSTIQRELKIVDDTAEKISLKTDFANSLKPETLSDKSQNLLGLQSKKEPVLENDVPVYPLLQRQPLGLTETLTQRSPLLQPKLEQSVETKPQQTPVSNRALNPPPENWSTIDDLLNLSSPSSLEPWEEQFRLQSPLSESSETLVSPIAEPTSQTPEIEGSAPPESLSSPIQDGKQPGAKTAISDEQLEFLAQMLYGMIRDRFFQEKECYFHCTATHPPWLNIISPDFFKSITPSFEANAPNAQHQSNTTIYPPPQEIETLAQEAYKLVQFKLAQNKERQGFFY